MIDAPCTVTATIIPTAIPISKVGTDGNFRKLKSRTVTIGKKHNRFNVKVSLITLCISNISGELTSPTYFIPIIPYSIIDMINAGIIVLAIELTWAYNSVSAAVEARTVVSDIGEKWSPKIDPDTAIPATIGAGIPIPCPIPIRANPTVAQVPQDVPVANEVTQHTANPAGKNISGLIICKP